MITFEQIRKANEGLSCIDFKGKDYVLVAQRVKAFRKLFPEGFIKTDILSIENGVCVMKTKVGYYESGHEVVLGTGLAYEKEANGYINETSFIENCETSSVGRALGFLALGIDGGGICSAEELMNAVANQRNDTVRTNTSKAAASEVVKQENPAADLSAIRTKLDAAIKNATKSMSRADKIKFINEVVTPTLQGERNWKLCDDTGMLTALLSTVEQMTA